MAWADGTIQTNPAANAILADSGALLAGQTGVKIILGGNIACVATIEHRDAANTGNVRTQTIASVANGVVDIDLPGITFALNERIRVRNNVVLVGSVHASIFTF